MQWPLSFVQQYIYAAYNLMKGYAFKTSTNLDNRTKSSLNSAVVIVVFTDTKTSHCVCLWMHHLIHTMCLSVLQGDSWNAKGSSPSTSFRSRHDSAPNRTQQGPAASVTKTRHASVPDSVKGKIYCYK